jgi:ESF2/ABP1 family protein
MDPSIFDDDNDNEDVESEEIAAKSNMLASIGSTEKNDNLISSTNESNVTPMPPLRRKKIHKLSLQKTTNLNKTLKNRGVLYIARIPPRMTPSKIKLLLSDFGEVTRIFLQEEDATVRKRRKQNGGTGAKRYVEGWVEMASKHIAKRTAASLHMTPITNHKRSPHFGDLWNLKYLSKFQWSHLTEKVAYERRVREQKLRLETLQARRETSEYKKLVEDGKKLDQIEERRRKRIPEEGTDHQSNKRKNPPRAQFKPVDNGLDKPMKSALLASLAK